MNVKQLYTNQITHMVRKHVPIARHYVGTVPSNETFHVIEHRPIHPGAHQNFPKYFIANTDTATQPGEHWVAFILKQPEHLEVFDSYGRPLHSYSDDLYTFSLNYKTVVENHRQYQSLFSEACGYMCLFYLHYRAKKEKMSQVLGRFHQHDLIGNDLLAERFVTHKMGRDLQLVIPREGQRNIRRHAAAYSNKITDLRSFKSQLDLPFDYTTEDRQELRTSHGITKSFYNY